MKKALLLLFFLGAIIQSYASDADRTIVKNLLRFYYVERINDPAYTPVLLDNNAIQGGNTTGGFWSNANMAGPQRLVRALLMPPSGGGDEYLQHIAAKILTLLNKPVKVNLLDDAVASVDIVT